MTEKMTAAQVKEAIRRYHGMHLGEGQWTAVSEAFSGPQSPGGGVDVMCFGAWRTAKVSVLEAAGVYKTKSPHKVDTRWPVVAYEVKVSRSDFKRELYGYTPGPKARRRGRSVGPWPEKASAAIERSHYFVFAVPAGLLSQEEMARRYPPSGEAVGGLYLPEGCGLVEVRPSGTIKVRQKALPSPTRALTAGEVGEVIRHGLNTNKDRMSIQTENFLRQSIKNNSKRLGNLATELDRMREVVARVLMVKDYNNASPYYVSKSSKDMLEYEYEKQTKKFDYTAAELEEVWRRSRIKFI